MKTHRFEMRNHLSSIPNFNIAAIVQCLLKRPAANFDDIHKYKSVYGIETPFVCSTSEFRTGT